MAFDSSKPNSAPFGSTVVHKATILKKVMGNGAIKVFTDSKGASERIEIVLTEGKVVINKDYELVSSMAHFKTIELYSSEDVLKDSIDIISQDSRIHVFTFYFHNSPIGRGNGDIGLSIAEAFVTGSVDPRYLAGASVDPEVIETIQNILKGKSV